MSERHVGFTGTRTGMNRPQREALKRLLVEFGESGPIVFHHGDCVGADYDAHEVAAALGCKVVIHPPSDPSKRGFQSADAVLPPLPYLERNHAIVDACAVLVASPMTTKEELRSGTWATVRYARSLGRDVRILGRQGQ